MKHLLCAVCCVVVLAGSSARADDFADFRIPTHRLTWWSADVGTSGSYQRRMLTSTWGRTSDLSGRLATQFDWVSTGDPAFTSVSVLAQGFAGRYREHWQSLTRPAPGFELIDGRRHTSRTTAEAVSGRVVHDRWLDEGGFFVGAEIGASTSLEQSRRRTELDALETGPSGSSQRLDDIQDRERWTRSRADAGLRMGLGRIRDVTSVYLARLMEHRLLERGALTRALTPATRRRLAELLVLADAADGIRDRPAAAVWTEVVRVLQEDGALSAGALDASSAMRVGEPALGAASWLARRDALPTTPVTRWRGQRLALLAVGTHDRATVFNPTERVSRTYFDGLFGYEVRVSETWTSREARDAASVGSELQWSRPFGPRWQCDVDARATTPVSPNDSGFEVVSSGAASWLLAERWLVRGTLVQRRTLLWDSPTGDVQRDRWNVGARLDVTYDVTDHVTCVLSARDEQSQDRRPQPAYPPNTAHVYSRDGQFVLQLTYRFTGRLIAPGFPGFAEAPVPPPGP